MHKFKNLKTAIKLKFNLNLSLKAILIADFTADLI